VSHALSLQQGSLRLKRSPVPARTTAARASHNGHAWAHTSYRIHTTSTRYWPRVYTWSGNCRISPNVDVSSHGRLGFIMPKSRPI